MILASSRKNSEFRGNHNNAPNQCDQTLLPIVSEKGFSKKEINLKPSIECKENKGIGQAQSFEKEEEEGDDLGKSQDSIKVGV